MSKVFLTGASGYIGGQVLRDLTRSQKEYAISALVRDPTKAATIEKVFPKVRTVIGDLDNTDLLVKEAADASIVLHLAATGHLNSVKAIHKGLASRQATQPAYWVQVSGASALAAGELASSSYVPGSSSSAVFDDCDGLADIQDVIRKYPSRAVDNYVLDTVSKDQNIKAALVFPPIIYGEGDGPINQGSIQLPALARATLKFGHGVTVGEGASRWGNVHVRDVGKIFLLLAEAAAEGRNDEQLWGQNGLYLTGVGELTFGDISAKVAAAAKQQGLISSDEVKELRTEEYDTALPHGKVLFGTNARSKAVRAKKLLNWSPKEVSLDEEIPRAVKEAHGLAK